MSLIFQIHCLVVFGVLINGHLIASGANFEGFATGTLELLTKANATLLLHVMPLRHVRLVHWVPAVLRCAALELPWLSMTHDLV